MDRALTATLVAGRGIEGNADQGGRRQVTLVDLECWQELMDRLGRDLEISARRANLVIDSFDLFDARGRTLRIGPTRLRVLGETRPCERMDEALPGLQAAMRERWGGGAFAEVIDGGEISVGDAVAWDDLSPIGRPPRDRRQPRTAVDGHLGNDDARPPRERD
jgi:MOSC domain-containing protein YiiM